MTVTFVAGADARRADVIEEQLRAFNLTHLSDEPEAVPLQIFALDGQGTVVGGLVGKTVWGWLEIGSLWVETALRSRGLGSRLLQEAENEAGRRGCRAARLSTWEFQARDFYERHGYRPYGRLDGYPEGHTVYYLRKELIDSSP
ncbi:MAG TPA: GNAT family N-acetyltransferase [Chloroflexota bacterium]|nr:GNAT family N-acetyltransferase [Chloroflexota bacterium]